VRALVDDCRAFKAIRRAEVVVFLLDAVDGIVEQDRVLADRIASDGRSCVIALNKWDNVPSKDDRTYLKAIENVRSQLPVLRWAEVVLTSALTGLRTEKLFDAVDRAAQQFGRRIPTAIINEVVQDATLWMAPPSVGSRSGRIYYRSETGTISQLSQPTSMCASPSSSHDLSLVFMHDYVF
jgi:GTPase